jgi:hypothetical protein
MVKRPGYTPEEWDKMSEAESEAARLEYKLSDLMEYLETGEIRSGLSLAASMAMYENQKWRWNSIKPHIAEFEQKWIQVYALVYADIIAIQNAAKEFEYKHWAGFCDEDVKELMKLYRKKEFIDWETATQDEKDAWYALWNPQGLGEGEDNLKAWRPYFERRSRKPVQKAYAESPCFLSSSKSIPERIAIAVGSKKAASFVDKHLKVAIGSSAGRVLLTMEDKVGRKDPENVFDGSHLTLIFAEDEERPCGGVQGMAATREEALGMLKALNEWMPSLATDTNLRIC